MLWAEGVSWPLFGVPEDPVHLGGAGASRTSLSGSCVMPWMWNKFRAFPLGFPPAPSPNLSLSTQPPCLSFSTVGSILAIRLLHTARAFPSASKLERSPACWKPARAAVPFPDTCCFYSGIVLL